MAADDSAGALLGREREVESLSRLIGGARLGTGGALVLRGEPGIGKTALIDHVVARAHGVRIMRSVGMESEMELPFAALQQLCSPVLDRLDRLPGPQRVALATVFGLSTDAPPDRFLVGLAALSLLSEIGAEQPVVCVIDDAQWLDQVSAQTLAFVARRLLADPVALLLVTRKELDVFAGLPELMIGALSDRDSHRLLNSLVPFVLDHDVLERVVAEAGGNPLALLELPRGLSPSQIAGGFATPAAGPISTRIEKRFQERLGALPEDVRGLMLVAAAEPVGDPSVVLGAAQSLGIGLTAAVAAEAEDLLRIEARLRFRHPLIRAAAYNESSPAERRRAHRALAEATDAKVDPDRRAWHLAQATAGPDEEVAVELERSAARARARGGMAASAAFLERATALTLDPYSRGRRAVAAAQAKQSAGASAAALRMLAAAETGPLDELQLAQCDLLRAHIAYLGRGGDAPTLLLKAAARLEPLDLRMARDTYLDALIAGHFAGRLATGAGLKDAAVAGARVPRTGQPSTASDLLLDALATSMIEGYAAGAQGLRQAAMAFRGPAVSVEEQLRWLWPAAHVAMSLWDDESYEALATRHIELGRQSGLLAVLPTALTTCVVAHTFAGDLRTADYLTHELHTLANAMEMPVPAYGPLIVAAWRGDEAAALAAIAGAIPEATARGEGGIIAFADYARSVICNAAGRYAEAVVAATSTDNFAMEGITIQTQGVAELIEGAARSGAIDRGAAALERLSEMTQASGTFWAAGIQARSHALLSGDDIAEDLYREAIEQLSHTRIRPQLARTHLVYGEWLRRQNRPTDAGAQLRTAHAMLSTMGIRGFAERARRELLANGETVRMRIDDTLTDLTPQEAQIARLAAAGHTNPEIGNQLFISSRTVEWHLRKVFTKLGVSSRRELRRVLRDPPQQDLSA